jgi:polyisoprenoid-binding protein YceI
VSPRLLVASLLAAALVAPAAPLAAQSQAGRAAGPVDPSRAVWTVDAAHSDLAFEIRHIVTNVRGTFKDWKATITIDAADWSRNAAIEVTIQTASIYTNNERRDNHLRTSDFFLADSFPQITFRSTRLERKGDAIRIPGDLTIRGVTKPVVLEGKVLGHVKQPNGAERLGIEASTTVNRLDYGVKWNRAVEGGGMTLGDDVKILVELSAMRRP